MEKKEMGNSLSIVMNVMSKNQSYFATESLMEIKVENRKGTVLYTEDLIDDDLDIDIATQCLKLVHNISMLSCFYISFVAQNNVDILNYKPDIDSDFYLKISIYPENVNIDKRKGFGLFAYNVDDMAYTLGEILPAMKNYIDKKIVENKKLKELEKVKNFIDKISCGLEPNAAFILFVNENLNLYEKYIQ